MPNILNVNHMHMPIVLMATWQSAAQSHTIKDGMGAWDDGMGAWDDCMGPGTGPGPGPDDMAGTGTCCCCGGCAVFDVGIIGGICSVCRCNMAYKTLPQLI